MTPLRRLLRAAVLVVGGTVLAGTPEAAEQQTLKAAYLCHFLSLTHWPAQNSPLVVGIYGTSREGEELAALLPNKVGTLTIKVIRLPLEVQAWGPVDAVYVPSAYQAQVPNLLRQVGAAPVLTIGTSAHFIDEGGMIGFLLEGNRLRFELNLGVASRKGLQISTRLQELARTIRR